MPQLTDKKKKLFFYLIIFILLSTQIAKKQYIEKKSQTRLNHIEVLGLSIEENIKVSKSLNSLLFKNILFLNKDNFYNILIDDQKDHFRSCFLYNVHSLIKYGSYLVLKVIYLYLQY